MRVCLTVVTAILLAHAPRVFGAEEDAPFSGPQPGEKLPALEVVLAYGKEADQTVDFVEQAAGKPALLVIVNGSNRPAARLTRVLMNYAEMHQDKLFAGVVYLDKDRAAALQYLQEAVSWWQVGPPVGVSIDGGEGPGAYGLNRNVHVTVLFANKGQVTSNFALVQPGETDAPRILKDVASSVGGRVPSENEVRFLSAPIHKLPPTRWHVAPADVRLRRLICTVLAAKDIASTRAAAAAIQKYIGDDQDRQAALGDAASLLLERRTRARGQAVVKQLQQWRLKYGARSTKNPR